MSRSAVLFLARDDSPNTNMRFGFDQKVYEVGAYVTGLSDGHNNIRAYTDSGKLISGASIKSVPIADWDTNYVSVMSKKAISYVVFNGDFMVMDKVKFDTSKPDVIEGKKKGGKKNGTDKDDYIEGKKKDDKLKGKDGNDTIFGKKGDDKLYGDKGNGTLNGGKGKDKLWGKKGQDTFFFDTVKTKDTIKDYKPSQDSILLGESAFVALGLGQLPDSQFSEGPVALDGNDYILYDPANGKLRYDPDGSGPLDPVLVAKLPSGLTMTADEFFVG
ncbi:MAG: calcium-binding protein [Hyphomicrobiales bacterium]|nr:calcium-binding protein [Hyphomicrobiales bacterium]